MTGMSTSQLPISSRLPKVEEGQVITVWPFCTSEFPDEVTGKVVRVSDEGVRISYYGGQREVLLPLADIADLWIEEYA